MADCLQDPVVALLAGGRSRRMRGDDKALALIGGERMIDRVLARLEPQSGTILLSAPHDHGTGLVFVPDGDAGPAGPAGAIRALAAHVMAQGGDAFVTVPVDAPFVPDDLVVRLCAHGPAAMARSKGAMQPVFARWSAAAVIAALPESRCTEKWSLHRLGEVTGALPVDFDPDVLVNVNTPEDLAAARKAAQDLAYAARR